MYWSLLNDVHIAYGFSINMLNSFLARNLLIQSTMDSRAVRIGHRCSVRTGRCRPPLTSFQLLSLRSCSSSTNCPPYCHHPLGPPQCPPIPTVIYPSHTSRYQSLPSIPCHPCHPCHQSLPISPPTSTPRPQARRVQPLKTSNSSEQNLVTIKLRLCF